MDDGGPVEPNHHLQHRYPAESRYCAMCGGALKPRIVLPDRKRLKVCERCCFVEFVGPKAVAGCLVVAERRILLLRRGNPPAIGKWTFPGGYIDLGETPAAAAIRETAEEVGLNVAIDRVHGVYADPARPDAMVVVYLAAAGPGARPSLSAEALEVGFFGADEIPWDDLAFRTTRDALEDWALAKAAARSG